MLTLHRRTYLTYGFVITFELSTFLRTFDIKFLSRTKNYLKCKLVEIYDNKKCTAPTRNNAPLSLVLKIYL